jgi:hypothetical protein
MSQPNAFALLSVLDDSTEWCGTFPTIEEAKAEGDALNKRLEPVHILLVPVLFQWNNA